MVGLYMHEFLLSLLFITSMAAKLTYKMSPASHDDVIHFINNKANASWTAGRNFDDETLHYMKSSLSHVRPKHNRLPSPVTNFIMTTDIPAEFDSRAKWPNCTTIGEIQDQGECNSCWAISTATVLTDRICISSKGSKNFRFSTEDLLSCCISGGNAGCVNGDIQDAFSCFQTIGIVSGGTYESNQGCRPYSYPPCNHWLSGSALNSTRRLKQCSETHMTPICAHQCRPGYDPPYHQDKRYGNGKKVGASVTSIQHEIMTYGPVAATFMVYDDFLHYKKGVYNHYYWAHEIGYHSVKIIGWGVERRKDYWLAANSWNPNWGDNGFFKIVRGREFQFFIALKKNEVLHAPNTRGRKKL